MIFRNIIIFLHVHSVLKSSRNYVPYIYQFAFKTSSSYILFLFVTRFTDVNVQQYTAINAFKLFVTKKKTQIYFVFTL